MKLLSTLSILLLTAVLLGGCDRAFTAEIENGTPPELHVFVRTADGEAVSGATVSLFRTAEDRDAGTNAFHSGTTDAEGKVVATESDLAQPGVVYVSASNGSETGVGATPYILLTDGITYFDLVIE